MIPEFDANNNLPPGMHDATMAEVQARFVHNEKRRQLFAGLVQVVSILKESNCPEVFLDGSFITAKELPNDYDLCYEPTGMAPAERLREFLEHSETRKERYLGDVFIHMPEPPFFVNHVTYWQRDGRNGDVAKGIIRIDLRLD